MESSRERSLIEEQMMDNTLFATWSDEWGVKVRPAYEIDKICFSFIQKGTNGKGNSFEIYMDCQSDDHICFDDIAFDIKNGRFEPILAYEKKKGEKYAKYYAYTTGSVGEKHLGICNSMSGKGYCLNAVIPTRYTKGFSGNPATDGKKQVVVNVPVSYHGLRKLCERYDISYKKRKDELEAIRCSSKTAAKNLRDNKESAEPTSFAIVGNSDANDSSSKKEQVIASDKTEGKKEFFINFRTDGDFFDAGSATKIAGHVYISETEVSEDISELFFYEKEREAVNKSQNKWYDRLADAVKNNSIKVRVKVRDYGIRNGRRQFQFISSAPAA